MTSTTRYFSAGAALLVLAWVLPHVLPMQLPALLVGLLVGLGIGLLLAGFLASRLPGGCDTGTPAQRRRYLREFLPAIGAYVVALLVSTWLLQRIDAPWLRTLVALMPVPAITLAMRAVLRHIRAVDELQRRIELEALSMATACITLLYLAAGFLQQARVIDVPAAVAMIWVFPLTCFTYGVAKVALARRYG